MIIHLQSYIPTEGYRLFAEDLQNATNYYSLGYNSMLLRKDGLLFFPEYEICSISELDMKRLSFISNHDVFHISTDGTVHLMFEANSDDNTLMLTGFCNSNCIMCPAHDNLRKHADKMQLSSVLELIRHIPEDTKHITITGGEPFMLKEDIFEILQALKDRLPKTDFLLLTNGRALSYKPYFDRFLETCPSRIILGIPIHGHNKESHDYITRTPGSFSQTRIAIKNLIRNGINVELRLVICKLNKDYITEIAELIKNEFPRIESVKFMGLEMLGNAAVNTEKVWISYQEAFRASQDAIDLLVANGIATELYNFPLCSVDRSYHLICKKSISSYKIRFPEVCSSCVIKDACGGLFSGSLRLAGKNVTPWRVYD